MSIKAALFANSDLRTGKWQIKAGAFIIEIYRSQGEQRSVGGTMAVDIQLDSNRFRVITPAAEDRIKDHVCFEFKNPLDGHVTIVHVNESDIVRSPSTWVDKNSQNVI